jgi:hypothetical protein
MVPQTIRLMPAGIAFGLLRPMRLLWLPVDDSDPQATTDSVLQIRVRVCDVACETHLGIPHRPCLEPATRADSA